MVGFEMGAPELMAEILALRAQLEQAEAAATGTTPRSATASHPPSRSGAANVRGTLRCPRRGQPSRASRGDHEPDVPTGLRRPRPIGETETKGLTCDPAPSTSTFIFFVAVLAPAPPMCCRRRWHGRRAKTARRREVELVGRHLTGWFPGCPVFSK